MLRWAVNTTQWTPTKLEWITGMRLIDNEDERRKITRYVFRKDAKHALIGRLMIRKCCNHFLGDNGWTQSSILRSSSFPSSLLLTRSEKGKPILLNCKYFSFVFISLFFSSNLLSYQTTNLAILLNIKNFNLIFHILEIFVFFLRERIFQSLALIL